MSRPSHFAAALLLGTAILAPPFLPARAQTAPAGHPAQGVTVSQAWSRATAPGGRNGAVFFTIHNTGAADTLVGASAPVAEKTELHETINDNGMMRMRPVPAVKIDQGKSVTFAPGGLHVMLLGLKAPLQQGAHFPVTLTFQKAGAVTVEAVVQGPGATTPGMMHGTMGRH